VIPESRQHSATIKDKKVDDVPKIEEQTSVTGEEPLALPSDSADPQADAQNNKPKPALPKMFPELHDPRLPDDAQDCSMYADHKVDRRVRAAEEWRLSLMCVEWTEIESGVKQGKGKQKLEKRRVARRLDMMRFEPGLKEWIDLKPERIEVVLV